jgi:hypothetical protein
MRITAVMPHTLNSPVIPSAPHRLIIPSSAYQLFGQFGTFWGESALNEFRGRESF